MLRVHIEWLTFWSLIWSKFTDKYRIRRTIVSKISWPLRLHKTQRINRRFICVLLTPRVCTCHPEIINLQIFSLSEKKLYLFSYKQVKLSYFHDLCNSPVSLNLLIRLYAVRSVQIPAFFSHKPRIVNKEICCFFHYDKNTN
jgi:hypothetical protein